VFQARNFTALFIHKEKKEKKRTEKEKETAVVSLYFSLSGGQSK
jgi:hypothetical protein